MAATGTQIENSVAQAIKIIADQRIENLKLDKTVRAVVDRHLGNNYYALIYNGGLMYAYADGDSEFVPGTSVYVLVPQGNFDERKRILGRTSTTSINSDTDNADSLLTDYAIIGNNLIQTKDISVTNRYDSAYPFGLNSYKTSPTVDGVQSEYQECKVLYDIEQLDNSYLSINTSNLYNYMQDAKGFMLAADFETVLDSEQVKGGSVGNYGLAITIKTKNTSAKYSTVQEEWDSLEPATQFEYNDEILRLNNFKNEIANVWNIENISLNECQNEILKITGDLESFILVGRDRIDKDALTLCQNYHDFLMELTTYTVNTQNLPLTVKDLEQIHSEWFADAIANSQYQTFTYQYTLDTLNMIGDPYNFKQKSRQYIINNIDAENFAGIERIYFFCQNFSPTNGGEAPHDVNTIFVSNIQFYCLKEAKNLNGDYRLDIGTPQGATFKTNSALETLPVTYTVLYKKYQDITNRCTAAWFQQDVNIIDNTQVGYNALAGSGWRQLVQGVTETGCTINAKQCGSYKNKFLCIVTSNSELVAKQQFTMFNDANHHNIEVIADSGSSFGFSTKAKTLTCYVDSSASNFSTAIPDENFRFIWSKDGYIFTETQEEIEAKLSNDNLDITLRQDLKNQLAKIKGITFDKNVLVFPSAQIDPTQPVIVKCTVQVTDSLEEEEYYTIGEAEIALTQVSEGTLKGYYIEIDNSSQVFQYNEAGVSPCSERYEQPYKPLPLSCRFFSPGGGIISEDKYTVKWQWPTTNTLLLIDDSIAAENPSTGVKDLYIQSTCPINIVEDYSYTAVNNQILCIIEFEGMTYTKATNFYFGKVGENGTNGTDVVAKIVPLAESTNTALLTEPLTLCIDERDPENVAYMWNTGAGLTNPILKLMLYKRNDLVDSSEYQLVKWSMAGDTASGRSRMSIQNSIASNGSDAIASINWNSTMSSDFERSNYIVRGQAGLNVKDSRNQTVVQKYYYHYPIPVIKKHADVNYEVGIDKEKTLRQVLYNKDGRNPQYDKNLGVRLIFSSDEDITTRTLKWSVVGGPDETQVNDGSSLRINDINSLEYQSEYQSDSAVQTSINNLNTQKQERTQQWQTESQTLYTLWTNYDETNKPIAMTAYQQALEKYNEDIAEIDAKLATLKKGADAFVKIIPTDTYSGAYCNNCVKIEIGTENTDSVTKEKVFNLEYTVIVPIHLSLNVYGLASLNSWDGNAVEINENKKYVLAPQVGAGIKNPEDNTFTGILIGQEETYDSNNKTTTNLGLLGYNHGKQSIFLDAQTGNATFGLPEDDAVNEGNSLTEGRIELRPGGVSKIAKWNFDARSLYRVASRSETKNIGTKNNATYTAQNPQPDGVDNYNLLAAPYKSIQYNTETKAWSAPAPKDAHGSIPHDQQGILLSALPAYVSFKGRPWKEDELNKDEMNRLINAGDSFEVEIDPNNTSLFTIYVHTKKESIDPETHETIAEWYRVPKVGIDNMGRFYTQSIRDEGTSSFVGLLGGFGIKADGTKEFTDGTISADQEPYIGAAYSFDGIAGDDRNSQALIKFMTNSNDIGFESPLYISSYADGGVWTPAEVDPETGEVKTPETNSGDEGTRPIGVYGGKYINLYAGDNDNQISPTKTTAIKLNHNPGNIVNDEPSNYSIQLIAQTSKIDNSQRAELLLNQTSEGSGLLYHARPWNTIIKGAYSGDFNSTYQQNVQGVANYIYRGDTGDTDGNQSIVGLLHHGLKLDIAKNIATSTNEETGEVTQISQALAGKIEIDYRNGEQILEVSPNSALFNQNNINNFSLNINNGILLQHLGQRQIVIEQKYGNEVIDADDIALTNAKLRLNAIGTVYGISMLAQGSAGNSLAKTNRVKFKMVPGAESAFYLEASGTKDGSYIQSHYQDLLNNQLPFSGVKIGPQLYVSSGAMIDGLLNDAAENDSVIKDIGLYVNNGIKTGQKAEGYKFAPWSYSKIVDEFNFNIESSSNLADALEQIMDEIIWVYGYAKEARALAVEANNNANNRVDWSTYNSHISAYNNHTHTLGNDVIKATGSGLQVTIDGTTHAVNNWTYASSGTTGKP